MSWDQAIAKVQLFRAEAEIEINDTECVLRDKWKGMSKEDRRHNFPWQDDTSKPPAAPPRDQIPRMAVYERVELLDLLQVAPPEALQELYEQINGGPQTKGWKHGVAELSHLLRGLLRPYTFGDKKTKK